MDSLKEYLLKELKKEQEKSDRFWQLKDWLKRVSMAEFESTRLAVQALSPKNEPAITEYKQSIYEALVEPVKEEIKWWKNN